MIATALQILAAVIGAIVVVVLAIVYYLAWIIKSSEEDEVDDYGYNTSPSVIKKSSGFSGNWPQGAWLGAEGGPAPSNRR